MANRPITELDAQGYLAHRWVGMWLTNSAIGLWGIVGSLWQYWLVLTQKGDLAKREALPMFEASLVAVIGTGIVVVLQLARRKWLWLAADRTFLSSSAKDWLRAAHPAHRRASALIVGSGTAGLAAGVVLLPRAPILAVVIIFVAIVALNFLTGVQAGAEYLWHRNGALDLALRACWPVVVGIAAVQIMYQPTFAIPLPLLVAVGAVGYAVLVAVSTRLPSIAG